MNTYLFIWNSNKYSEGINEMSTYSEKMAKGEDVIDRWSCTSKAENGSRVFIYHCGGENKGIFASGYITSDPFIDKNWNSKSKRERTWYVYYKIDKLIYPLDDKIISLEQLKQIPRFKVPRLSGLELSNSVSQEIEALWEKVKSNLNKQITTTSTTEYENMKHNAGFMVQKYVNSFERNPKARAACIDHFGYQCRICGFDFKKVYGVYGDNVIEVHHLVPVSKIKEQYIINPISDLIPVCPNCHTMLHIKHGNETFTPDEVKEMIIRNQKL